MAKIELDKYYTPREIAVRCYEKALDVVGKENVSEILEPSAGGGVFLDIDERIKGYDIAPEHPRVEQADYLNLRIEYKKGRMVLGNPPYGRCMNMAQKFYKKSVEVGDYIAFILPISQLQNNDYLYEFELIHSEDLGVADYSGRELHCCFNLYRRGEELRKKSINKLKDITIIRQDRKGYMEKPFDVRMCYWGNGTAGKILQEGERYAGEYKIQIHKEGAEKERIKEFIETYDWNGHIKGIAMKRMKQWEILKVIQDNIEGIE